MQGNNNISINFDKTPTNGNKLDNSPNTNLSIPGFKTPSNQIGFKMDEDNSRGYYRSNYYEPQDFESKVYAYNQANSYLFSKPVLSSNLDPFMPRTPVNNTPMNNLNNNANDNEGEITKGKSQPE